MVIAAHYVQCAHFRLVQVTPCRFVGTNFEQLQVGHLVAVPFDADHFYGVVTRSDADRICGHRTTPLVIPEVLVLRVIFFFVVSVILGSYTSLIDDNPGSTVGLETCSEQEFNWLLEAYFDSLLLDELSTSSIADSLVVETR